MADVRSKRPRTAPAAALHVHRLPPNSPEAERGVLGCILLSPATCLPEAVQLVKPECFYDLRNRSIFESMLKLSEKPTPIDTILLCQELKNTNMLEGCGGYAYVATLPDSVPSSANLSYYARVVVEKYVLRELIQASTEVIGRLYDHEGDVDNVLDSVESRIMSVRANLRRGEITDIRDSVREVINDVELQNSEAHKLIGLPSGFSDLDQITGGFRNGDFIIIAARPSLGKTSLAMNMADHIAIDLRIPVGIFSLEMTRKQLVSRMMSSRSRVNLTHTRGRELYERESPRIVGASGKVAGAPIYIDDTGGLSILELRSRARLMKQKHGVRVILVDYLQLATSTQRRARDSREQEVSDVSMGMKSLAKELDLPIIALAQLNRDIEKDKNRKPRLSDLRSSGSLEQDADVVAFLYNASDDTYSDVIPVNLLVAKHRNGPLGEVHFTFLKDITRFELAAKIYNEDVPPPPAGATKRTRTIYGRTDNE